MQIRKFPCLILLVLSPLLMAADGSAQQSHELVVNIPFDFTVCRQQMPPGKYRVQPISSASTGILLVRGEDRSAEIVCTNDIQAPKTVTGGKLIFNRYGDQYFLSELWFAGEKTGHGLVKTEREEALLRELTPRKKREKVTVKITETKPN